MYIIKKDGTKEPFNVQKVVAAVNKSAERVLYTFKPDELDFICRFVTEKCEALGADGIMIAQMHNIVEGALDAINPAVAKSYRDYRNYKTDFVQMLDTVYKKSQSIMYIGDKENSNADSALVSTRRSLIFNQLNKQLYQKFFLTVEELQAQRDGYIYIHDMSARRDTMNCCLFDVGAVLRGGFEMGNLWYNEPKTLNVAGIDGLLMMWVGDENYAPYAALAEKGLPIAFINRQPENPRFSFFSVDYTREAYRAVEYLLMAGHREIMMVTGGGASMELRERGYYQAFAARRLPSPSGLVLRDPTVDELAGVLKERRPTAAFLLFGCQTPTFAVAAERAGLQIPGDVSLICFDDMDRVAGVSFPVSCIRMPLFQMGQAALTHLLRRLEEPETEPVRRIVGAELCINSSCRILEP